MGSQVLERLILILYFFKVTELVNGQTGIWFWNLCTKPLNCLLPSLDICKQSDVAEISLKGFFPLQDWTIAGYLKIFNLASAILRIETLNSTSLAVVSICHLHILTEMGKSLEKAKKN